MSKIKKYAGILNGYTIKSAWSSPELLKNRRLMPSRIEQSDDVYSFGMVLWELFTDQIPFLGYSLEDIILKVAYEGYKPEIPLYVNEDIAELILSCWFILV